ncbi:MAG: HlyD family efflux transporter periplasmic adaptor subunit, partial [Oscillospiraceae bacterium]|nr:HlyD family efflux transporter periplasmic adaptor subunit [Oscillospiraceae bacterium]
DMIDKCTVKAPKSGIITSLNIAEGSIPTTDALMTIENTDALKITVSIAEQDILKIHKGMKATVKTNATGDEEFDATVSRVVNIYKADTSAAAMMGGSSSGGYSAEITIDDKSTDLLIGMNAKVKIMLQSKTDVLAVPYESIITDEEDESDDPEQYVLLAITGDDNITRAKKAVVKSGMEGNYYTEITSDEVKEGDRIVITPGEYKDGDVLPIFDFNAALNKDKKSDEGGKDE